MNKYLTALALTGGMLAAKDSAAQDKADQPDPHGWSVKGTLLGRVGTQAGAMPENGIFLPVYSQKPGMFLNATMNFIKEMGENTLTTSVSLGSRNTVNVPDINEKAAGNYMYPAISLKLDMPEKLAVDVYANSFQPAGHGNGEITQYNAGFNVSTNGPKLAKAWNTKVKGGARLGGKDNAVNPAMAYIEAGAAHGKAEILAGLFAPFHGKPQAMMEATVPLTENTRLFTQGFVNLPEDGAEAKPYDTRLYGRLTHAWENVAVDTRAMISRHGFEELGMGVTLDEGKTFSTKVEGGVVQHPGTHKTQPFARVTWTVGF